MLQLEQVGEVEDCIKPSSRTSVGSHRTNRSKLWLFASVLNDPSVSWNCAMLEVCMIVSSLINIFWRHTANILWPSSLWAAM